MKKNISVICHNISCDPRNGYGAAFKIYEVLASKYNFDVNIIVIRDFDVSNAEPVKITKNIKKYIVSPDRMLSNVKNNWDYYRSIGEDEGVRQALHNITQNSDIIICDGIFYVSMAKKVLANKKVYFRSVDIEYDKAEYFYTYHRDDYIYSKLDEKRFAEELKCIFEFEQAACRDADVILTLTEADRIRKCELYGISPEKVKLLPICVDASKFDCYIPKKRTQNGSMKCLLISNTMIDNEKSFLSAATELPDIEFHIIGKCGYYMKETPENVIIHGRVSEEEKHNITSECHFALNLSYMTFGMNVKMSDYFLMGIPVCANKLGARGYDIQEQIHYFPADFDTLAHDIKAFCQLNDDERYAIALNAYEHICTEFGDEKHLNKYIKATNDSSEGTECYIFGAGIIGKQSFAELHDKGYKCIGFIDNDKKRHGTDYCNKKIISPETAFEQINNKQDIRVIISVGSRYLGEVVKQVLDYIPPQKIIVYDSYSTDSFLNLEMLDIDKIIKNT